jgi:hypothetical protein
VETGDQGISTSTDDRDRLGARLGRLSSLVVLAGAMAALVAGATLWLLLSNPVVVANAVDGGEVTPLVRELAIVLYNAFIGLLDFF